MESFGLQDAHGYAWLMVNYCEALLFLGRVSQAATLIPAEPPRTLNAWPLMWSRAQIALRTGERDAVAAEVDALRSIGLREVQMVMWPTETEMSLHLQEGMPDLAWRLAEDYVPQIVDAQGSKCLDRMLCLAARALTDTLSADPSPRRVEALQSWAERAGCYSRPAAFRVAAAHAKQFQAELTRTDQEERVPRWAQTVAAWADLGCPHEQAYALWRRAEALLDQRRHGDAAVDLRSAAILATGHIPLTHQIGGLARRARIDLADTESPGGERNVRDSPDGALGLTARELSVLELLTAGRTNAQIGAALYMSPKTASVHVSAILRKLGVSSRVQAAGLAERHGLFLDRRSP
jgi:DNA-binding CsgD family transcriptional regulator